jgi:hypothetical protein
MGEATVAKRIRHYISVRIMPLSIMTLKVVLMRIMILIVMPIRIPPS